MAAPKPQPFVQALVQSLLAPEQARLDAVLADILKAAKRIGHSDKAFLYDGRIFHLLPMSQIRGEPIKPLHFSLVGEITYYLSQEQELNRTSQKLRQGLSVVTGKCVTKEDFRNALPDILVREVEAFRGIPRTKPEGFMLEDNPRLMSQYKSVIALAITYAARRLLY